MSMSGGFLALLQTEVKASFLRDVSTVGCSAASFFCKAVYTFVG